MGWGIGSQYCRGNFGDSCCGSTTVNILFWQFQYFKTRIGINIELHRIKIVNSFDGIKASSIENAKRFCGLKMCSWCVHCVKGISHHGDGKGTRTVETGWGWGHNLWGWDRNSGDSWGWGQVLSPMQLSSSGFLKVSQRVTFRECWNKILIVG